MKVSEAIKGVATLFLDTAPIIYLVEQNHIILSASSASFKGLMTVTSAH